MLLVAREGPGGLGQNCPPFRSLYHCQILLLPPTLLLPCLPGPILPGCWVLDPGHAGHCIPSCTCIQGLCYVAKESLIWKLGGMGTPSVASPSSASPDHPPPNSPADSLGSCGRERPLEEQCSPSSASNLMTAEPSRNLLQEIRDVVFWVPAGRQAGERSKAWVVGLGPGVSSIK